ncbi:alpha/beta hydrolase [Halioxenophilus sp. WMMB6]|uniref:alpha/beta fold hydrolase n=1 Tax=Halioxenophilus sp. WMMB6 TaxID=3073815 RepID=UPI00295E296B|nr:alpha/beta hydrolase [Halioxenophilus sp. WMMB6]
MYVNIAGMPQWLQIEMQSADNPVLLLIHGGPGASTRFASSAWQAWKQYFTLVHWDQRGTGLTLAQNGPELSYPMSFNQIVEDGIAVAEYLRDHLPNRPLVLLGHSWGSAVAVAMCARRPELFSAFVGTGLLVNYDENEEINHRKELQAAERAGNIEALAALTEIGPPPFHDVEQLMVLRQWGDKLCQGTGDTPYPQVMPPSDFTATDRELIQQGMLFSAQSLFNELCAIDLPQLGLEFNIPMFCLMGGSDQQTDFELAEHYFESIQAPHKEVVAFAGCHHFVHMNRPDAFLEVMVNRVLPRVM